MRRIRIHSVRKNLALALLLLFAANTVMGTIMAIHGKRTCMKITKQRMLDIANTAADMLDGDVLENITREDMMTPEYQQQYYILSEFKINIELSYIYAVRPAPDGSYDFIIDPDTEAPAEFGEDIVDTSFLHKAADGLAVAEDKPHTDEWGTFYSAYSPVFGSHGKVVAIVGVDFDATLVEKEVVRHIWMIAGILAVIMLFGFLLALFISFTSRQRIERLNHELHTLRKGFEKLNETMMQSCQAKLELITDREQRELLKTLADGEMYGEEGNDEYSEIGKGLHSMQEELDRYIRFLNEQTFRDPMTGVGNKSAYQARIRKIEEAIWAKTADFAVVFFDINQLKAVNTNYGFERGDELMIAAGRIMKSVFGNDNIYRVASDEFIAIVENISERDMEQNFSDFDYEISEFNKDRDNLPKLSVAHGTMFFQPDRMKNYRQVFIKAEANMHTDKDAFYEARKPSQDTFK